MQILLVEDNPADVLFLREAMAGETLAEFDLTVAESLGDALALLSAQTFAAVLLDLGLPDSQGLPTFLKLHQSAPDLPVVVLSALADEEVATQAIQAGAQDYLIKRPQDFLSAGRAVRYAIERQKISAKLLASEEKFHSVVACTPNIIFTVDRQNLIQFINRVPAGLTTEEAIGTSALGYVQPEYRGRVEEAIRSVFETGRETSYEIQARGPNETVAWFSTRLASLNRGAADEQVLLITQDITEHKQAEAELRLHGEVMANMAEGVALVRAADLAITYTNPKFDALFGYAAGELIGEHIWILNAPGEHDPKDVARSIEKTLQETGFWNGEVQNIRKDGATFWCASSISALDHPQYGMVWVTVQTDITPRKVAEQKIRESEQFLKESQQIANMGSWRLDLATFKVDWSENCYRLYGFEPHEVEPSFAVFKQVVYPDDLPVVEETFRDVLQNPRPRYDELRILDKHGHVKWIANSLMPEVVDGQLTQLKGVQIDITERKQAQIALAELNRTLEERVKKATAEVEDLYENAPAGYHSLDVDGKIVRINQTELNWLGYSREELLGQPFAKLLTPASLTAFQATYPQFKQCGRLQDLELEFVRKDGTILYTVVNASAVQDDNGVYLMSRSTVFDVTHRREAEQALRESEAQLRISRDKLSAANAALEKAARMKDEFLASMSHELRTPLTGILVLSESMQLNTYGMLTARQYEVLKHIEESGHHLLNLINDILDLSKIEVGMLELIIEPVSLAEVCQAGLQLTKGMAHKKQQTVSFAMSPNSIQVRGDARRLKQMLVNLLSNAIKFTPQNGSLGLEVRADQADQVVRLTVWDAGIGIAPENLELLFQPFVQLDSSLARQYEGTGLGLSLVQRMVELHGGSVQVESVLGQGSRFTIALPWMPSEIARVASLSAQNAASTPPARSTQPIVLIVDDNELTIDTIGDYLELRDFHVVAVRSSAELLEAAADLQPDLILMDIQMPVMDGFEATRRVRSHPDPRVARVPIIALTALAMSGDRERCLAAGANEYLSKPVGLKQLVETIHGLLERA